MRLLSLTFILIAAGFFLMMAGLLRGASGTWEFLIGGGLASLGALAAAVLAGKIVWDLWKKK